jgi:hypothetical protein
MHTIKGRSASGKVNRVIHILKQGDELMLSVGSPNSLFKRDGAVIVSAQELLKKVVALQKGNRRKS